MAGLFRWYTLRQSIQGNVLWNANDAYLFIGILRDGYNGSYLLLPFSEALEYMGNAPPISDSRLSLVVIRVTSSGVERRVLELPDQDDRSGYNPNASPGVNGNIYASYPNAGYVRWAVDHFERITLDERKQFPRGQMISLPDFENDANGWSRHTLFSEPLGVPLDIDVGNQFKIRVNNVKTTDGALLLIDLLHPEGAIERLFDFESHSLREVGAFEYRPAFKREVRK